MPRYAYWTILVGDTPTAFRARDRVDLLPTLKQLQKHSPDAVLRWFERGRIWDSPEAARAADRRSGEKRDPGWRPGGTHRDPRERYQRKPGDRDKRRARFKQRLIAMRRSQAENAGQTDVPERQDRPPDVGRDRQERAGRPPLDWRPPPARTGETRPTDGRGDDSVRTRPNADRGHRGERQARPRGAGKGRDDRPDQKRARTGDRDRSERLDWRPRPPGEARGAGRERQRDRAPQRESGRERRDRGPLEWKPRGSPDGSTKGGADRGTRPPDRARREGSTSTGAAKPPRGAARTTRPRRNDAGRSREGQARPPGRNRNGGDRPPRKKPR